MNVKEQVRQLLDRLPDNCTLEDVQYHLYVIQKIEKGVAEVDAGKWIAHEEVKAQMTRRVNE